MRKREIAFPLWWGVAFVGLLAFAIRAWAEFKIGIAPIGFDSSTAYVESYGRLVPGLSSLGSFTLLYWIYYALSSLGVPVFVGIALTGTLLFALMGMLMVAVARRTFGLSVLSSTMVGVVGALSLGGLRFAWDLHRNMLGMVCVLIVVLCIGEYIRSRRILWFLPIGIAIFLTLAAHQLAAGVLVAGIIIWALSALIRKIGLSPIVESALWLIAGVAGWWLASRFALGTLSLTSVIPAGERVVQATQSYHLVWLVFGPFFILFGSAGLLRSRNRLLCFLALMFLVQGLSPLLAPDYAFTHWDRWLYHLTFPLALGVGYYLESIRLKGWQRVYVVSFLVLLIIAPSYRMVSASKSLYVRQDVGDMFNLFPASFQANALAANPTEVRSLRVLPACLDELRSYLPENRIVVPGTYSPVIVRLRDDTDEWFTFEPPQKNWYGLGYQLQFDKRFERIETSNPDCYQFIVK